MCGITGQFRPDGQIDAAVLHSMNRVQSHRGPDNDGMFLDGPIALGHSRLSIIDLDTGRQPIFNENDSVAIVFNGEIYNYRTLRNSLSSSGHSFSTETDTEVLVHLYEEHGPTFVEHLRGMFAFALWDDEAERLLLARDRMGIKPLHFAQNGECVTFASELSALLESDITHGGLDRTALAQYFGFGFVPAPLTAFDNLSKLRPGELILISNDGVHRDSYYTPSVQSTAPGLDIAAVTLRNHLERAVETRLQSDVPLGAFLSGGIDSSIIVGTLSECLDEPVQTFTVGFKSDLFDEAWAARKVANYHGTDHTEFTISSGDVREAIPEVLGRLGEPFGDQSLIPTYVVGRETSGAVKVAHSGDGADELFGGYDRYRGEFLSKYYRLLPKTLRARAIEPLTGRLPAARDSPTGELGRQLRKFTRGGEADRCNRHVEWMRIPNGRATTVVDPEMLAQCRDAMQQEHAAARSWLPADRNDALAEMQAVDVRYTLPNQMLRKVDTASMYNSLEVRVPFLDTDVVEYALGLPTNYKMTIRSRKRVLKRAFEDILPSAILQRDKQGFDMPVGEWFKDELADEFRETVGDLRTDVVDIDGVMGIYDDHVSGRGAHGKFLWTSYVFASWLRRMRADGVLPEPS